MLRQLFYKCENYFLAEGIVFTILGVMMIVLPRITTFTTALIVSVLLFVGGLYKFVNSLILRKEISNFWLSIAISILMMATGIYLTLNPLFNIFILTAIIGTYFLLRGINSSVFSIKNRHYLNFWWLGLLTAGLQFILAAIILASLPFGAMWTIGILLGVEFIFSGLAMTGLSSTCKAISKESSHDYY